MPRARPDFDINIFINCPFDDDYKPMLQALIFTIVDCGFEPRIASERSDSGESRMEKIKKLIKESRYSIHDISRMEALREGDIPRFNMPFELGVDLGCRDFGSGNLSKKKCLILEKDKHRYRKALSDISGNDIMSHDSSPETLVRVVRNWIYSNTEKKYISPGAKIWQLYNEFYSNFEISVQDSGFSEKDIEEMSIIEFIYFIKVWKYNVD